jgi:divalent metal cation (Fe/Co/Zn/Cd) transporter
MPDTSATSLSAQSQLTLRARRADLRLGIAVEIVTLIWMVVEAAVALSAGFVARSASLESFGLDSVIELIGGGVLLWRLRAEQRGVAGEALEHTERRASRIVGWALYALALYILLNATFSLVTRARPEENWAGLGLAIAAVLVMPILWRLKLRVARRINSAALRADAACSVSCAYMSLVLLVGLALTWTSGWWWADALASLGLLYFVIREGHEALKESRGHACACGEA